MPIDTITSTAGAIVTTPLGFFFVLLLMSEWKYSKKIIHTMVAALFLALVLADLLILWRLGVNQLGRAVVAKLNMLCCLGFVLLFAKRRDGRLVFSFFSGCLFIFISDTVSDTFSDGQGPAYLAIKLASYLVMWLLVLRFFRRPYLTVMEEVKSGWWKLSLIPFLLSLLFVTLLILPGPLYLNPQHQPAALVLSLSVACIYYGLYYIFSIVQGQYQAQKDNAVLRAQMRLLEEHAKTMQLMSDQSRIFRHDVRHYVRMLNLCLDQNDQDGMRELLAAMDGNLASGYETRPLRVYTRCPVIDAVLSFYADKVEKEKIAFTVRLNLPGDLEADMTQLAVVLSNALENAYNACVKIPQGEKRCIRVTGEPEKSQFFLEISNTFQGEVRFHADTGIPVSREPGHGYGSQSIAAFAQKYKALVHYGASDGWFRLRILF